MIRSRKWMALVAGTVTAAGVIALTGLLSVRDRTYVRQQLRSEAERTRDLVEANVEEVTRATERLGEQWINRAGMAEPEWVVEAEATLRDVAGLEGLVWFDATRTARFRAFRADRIGGDDPIETVTPVLRRLEPPGSGRPRTLVLPAGGEGEGAVVVPLCYLTQCDGYLVGTFSAASVFRAVSRNVPAGFEVILQAGDRVVAGHPAPPDSSAGAPGPGASPDAVASLPLAFLGWVLTQVPSETALASLRSRLPVAVLAGGLATALLLTLALWFAAVSDGHRREADAHRALVQESERRFRATFDSAFQMVWLLTPDGNLLEANATALAGVGTADDLRGRPLWDTPWFSLPADAERMRAAVGEAAEGRVVRYEDTLSGGDGDGTVHVLDLSIKPIRSAEGQVGQVLCEGRDITQRRRAEAAITELQTLSSMGRMAARVAHEINNPLAGIRNSFLLVKDAVPPDHPHYRFVGAIEREIGRIAVVTRQLYETYRPDQELHAACAVGTVLSDVAALLHQVNRERDVAIAVDTSGISGTVPVAEAVVRQVAYNIIQNAVEASRLGGTVRVSASVEGRGEGNGDGTLLLIVEDDGPGIPPAMRDRIFEPFYSTKTGLSTGGMGLGLALVRRSVEALHGSIIIGDSTRGGARFEIRIPLSVTTAASGGDT